jgi:hypothetical protein
MKGTPMSYCRWGKDSDVYCYESCRHIWVILIAHNRIITDDSLPWPESDKAVPIGLPFDGETFSEYSPQEAAERLQALKDLGYRVSDSVIATLRNELYEHKDLSTKTNEDKNTPPDDYPYSDEYLKKWICDKVKNDKK